MTIKIVLGTATPGGGFPLYGDKLAETWGQPVLIENATGAGANVAGDRAAKAAPDGYTLLMASNAQIVINPSLYEKMSFDPAKDIAALVREAKKLPDLRLMIVDPIASAVAGLPSAKLRVKTSAWIWRDASTGTSPPEMCTRSCAP